MHDDDGVVLESLLLCAADTAHHPEMCLSCYYKEEKNERALDRIQTQFCEWNSGVSRAVEKVNSEFWKIFLPELSVLEFYPLKQVGKFFCLNLVIQRLNCCIQNPCRKSEMMQEIPDYVIKSN